MIAAGQPASKWTGAQKTLSLCDPFRTERSQQEGEGEGGKRSEAWKEARGVSKEGAVGGSEESAQTSNSEVTQLFVPLSFPHISKPLILEEPTHPPLASCVLFPSHRLGISSPLPLPEHQCHRLIGAATATAAGSHPETLGSAAVRFFQQA